MIMTNQAQSLRTWRINAGLSTTELARLAKLTDATIIQAERGDPIRTGTAKKIADALSKSYGVPIKVTDLEGLNVK